MDDLIKQGEVVAQPLPPVAEQAVQFNLLSDRSVLQVVNPNNNEVMIQISGYDLDVNFNMEHLRCVEDIEAACSGIAKLFREIILDKLLTHKHQD